MLSHTNLQLVRKFWVIFLTAFIWTGSLGNAQELTVQPTPFTALLDFALLRNPVIPKQSLPIWLESVQIIPAESADATVAVDSGIPMGLPEEKQPPHTVFRIRLRSMPNLGSHLLLRLFFEDRPDAHPRITAWSETGTCCFASPPLGSGLNLPASESLSIPVNGADYLEIDVPGDGQNVRKALLSTLQSRAVNTALDFAAVPSPGASAPVIDPFGNPSSQPLPANDTYLFGRVRATLEPGTLKLEPSPSRLAQSGASAAQSSVSFVFNLETEPLLAFVTLEILNADPQASLQAWANDKSLGPVVPQYPDLADPAYTGMARPLEPMRFRYTGWLRAQVMIPGSALHPGENTITLQLPSDAAPAAIRAVELQLKHNWRSLDYSFAP